MATFRVKPDKRYSRKNNEHRYCLITTVEGKVRYLPLKYEISQEQYDLAFKKMSTRSDCIDLREEFHAIETKAERIYNSMRRYDPKRFKELFSGKGELTNDLDMDLPQTLELAALTEYYLSKANIKRSTKIHFRCSLKVIDKYSPGIHMDEIDPRFLREFESKMKSQGKSISTVSSYLRNLRTLINYFKDQKRILPADFVYPFGKAGHSIRNVRKKKRVMSEDDILKVIELEEFDSPKQEYARDIWLFLYNANGLNPIDLLKLRWDSIKEDHIPVIRTKTETTRVYDIQEITVPMTEELMYYLDKVGDHSSPFVLGKLKEGYSETTLLNRKNRFRQEINLELRKIGERLNLPVSLTMSTARDCYAMTLKRNGVPREHTSDSLGHSDIRTTSHYLDSLSIDESFTVNNNLVKRKNRKAG
jgi:site-specific recombinase XerD